MTRLIISNWVGRLSNNILQLIRAVHYANIHGYKFIFLSPHNFFFKTIIILDITDNSNNKPEVFNSFFYLRELNIEDPPPIKMKEYFNKYIKPLLKLTPDNVIGNNENDLYIHIRSGDCFTLNAHKMYVPPPYIYYTNIIENKTWDNIIVVYEDDKNPCVNLLKNKNYNNITFVSSSLENDLSVLSKCQNLAIGFGTFGLLIYFLSNNIKNLYIPDYAYYEMPKGDWGLNLNIINLPDYIKCGEWKLTNENVSKVINHKI